METKSNVLPALLSVAAGGGKYTVTQEASGRLSASRYGEPWRDCTGDNLVLCLAQDLSEALGEVARLKRARSKAEEEMRAAPDEADLATELQKLLKTMKMWRENWDAPQRFETSDTDAAVRDLERVAGAASPPCPAT